MQTEHAIKEAAYQEKKWEGVKYAQLGKSQSHCCDCSLSTTHFKQSAFGNNVLYVQFLF